MSEIVDTTRFDENSDLSTTYLGKVNMTHDRDLIVEEKFPISKSGLYSRQINGWNRMSNTIRYRGK